MTFSLLYTRRASRQLAERLPEPVAVACLEFCAGALADNPRRVGKPLRPPLDGLHAARRGSFRVIYRIDDEQVTVLVVTIDHRRDVYREGGEA